MEPLAWLVGAPTPSADPDCGPAWDTGGAGATGDREIASSFEGNSEAIALRGPVGIDYLILS